MRQKTCLTADGRVFLGFAVSAAAKPTSSVPAKEKAAVTNTLHKPLKPLLKAPGLYQYRSPMYSPLGLPPVSMQIPRMLLNHQHILASQVEVWKALHETNHSNNLDDREDKLCFTISLDAEEVYGNNDDQEDRNPDGAIDITRSFPERYSYGGCNDLEWESDQPSESIAEEG